MVEKILNNTIPYGKIRASHEGSLHSSTLTQILIEVMLQDLKALGRVPNTIVCGAD